MRKMRTYLLLVDVDLVETVPEPLLLAHVGDFLEDRGDHLARTAPCRPEVDQGRLVACDL